MLVKNRVDRTMLEEIKDEKLKQEILRLMKKSKPIKLEKDKPVKIDDNLYVIWTNNKLVFYEEIEDE